MLVLMLLRVGGERGGGREGGREGGEGSFTLLGNRRGHYHFFLCVFEIAFSLLIFCFVFLFPSDGGRSGSFYKNLALVNPS